MPVLHFGAEGEIRTLEASLEDSHVSNYITPAFWSAPAERSGHGALVWVEDYKQ
jgi:hypothetical protein